MKLEYKHVCAIDFALCQRVRDLENRIKLSTQLENHENIDTATKLLTTTTEAMEIIRSWGGKQP